MDLFKSDENKLNDAIIEENIEKVVSILEY